MGRGGRGGTQTTRKGPGAWKRNRWRLTADRDSNTIEVFVTRIRKKLGADVITTIRGLGYSLDDPDGQPRAN